MLNRTIAPTFKTIDRIDVMQVTESRLNNNIPLFTLSAGSQEIVKIEFIFKAGMFYQPKTLIASGTNALLETGTKSYTANQISDGIDFYGSFLELQVDQDFASVTLFSLNKYLDKSLSFLEEVIKSPTFPENEFKIHYANKKQKHIINSQKVSVLARRKFSQILFGQHHPYGVDVLESDFDRVSINELKLFFHQHYHSANCSIIASGKLPNNLLNTLNTYFGGNDWTNSTQHTVSVNSSIKIDTSTEQKHLIVKDDAIQSAIRIGRVLFNKTHPDYYKFQVLNTILGGYFGSRLMANIREDKGFTYGIGSGLNNMVNAGYFYISTEVGADVTSQALAEIYKELHLLRTKLVSDNELETVRNYILGHFLRSVDGPFALSDKFKAIWEFNLDYTFYENYFAAVKSVTAKEIRDLANNYLQDKDLLECVVGKI